MAQHPGKITLQQTGMSFSVQQKWHFIKRLAMMLEDGVIGSLDEAGTLGLFGNQGYTPEQAREFVEVYERDINTQRKNLQSWLNKSKHLSLG